LGLTSGAVVFRSGRLLRVAPDIEPVTLVEGLREVEHLCACRDGKHFAFWNREDERFRLMNVAGERVFSRRINTDKALAQDIWFSPSGDAVGFIDDYDGGRRLHLYELATGATTEFGPSFEPIGYDANLRAFVEAPVQWRRVDAFCSLPSPAPENRLGILSRKRKVRGYFERRPERWSALAIQSGLEGLVALEERNLCWLSLGAAGPTGVVRAMRSLLSLFSSGSSRGAAGPTGVVRECVPDEGWKPWDRCSLRVDGDLALIHTGDQAAAVLVHRTSGVLRGAGGVLSAGLDAGRVLLHFDTGAVEVLASDGRTELLWAPEAGHETMAAGLAGGALRVVEFRAAGGGYRFSRRPLP